MSAEATWPRRRPATTTGWARSVSSRTPQFSHDRGFYDAAFNLEITTATAAATIRYTTDGSLPTLTNGTTYAGPIAIDPASVVNGERAPS